jgi:hypothetical protein
MNPASIHPLAALASLAALALLAGGVWTWRQPGANRTKAGLMMLASGVVAFNAWVANLPI